MSTNAEWVERLLGLKLNDFQKTAVTMICSCMGCGAYDFANTFKKADWRERSVKFNIPSLRGLATYDSNGLTNLVVLAHDNAIRVEVEPCNPRYLTVWMHERKRDEDHMHLRHPTIEEAIARIRG